MFYISQFIFRVFLSILLNCVKVCDCHTFNKRLLTYIVTCHTGSHSVSCHPAEVTFPPLPQSFKACTRFIDPGGICKAELTSGLGYRLSAWRRGMENVAISCTNTSWSVAVVVDGRTLGYYLVEMVISTEVRRPGFASTNMDCRTIRLLSPWQLSLSVSLSSRLKSSLWRAVENGAFAGSVMYTSQFFWDNKVVANGVITWPE